MSRGFSYYWLAFWLIAFLSGPPMLHAAGFVVDTTDDVEDGDVSSIANLLSDPGADGKFSLRECITAINNDGTGFNIYFDNSVFPTNAQAVIVLQGNQLPSLQIDSTLIYAGDAGVTLDGSDLTDGSDGITIEASFCTVQGLWIRNFADDGIEVTGPNTQDVLIGGGDTTYANYLINNGDNGIEITAEKNVNIVGNYIGTYPGWEDRGNGSNGIYLNGVGDILVGGAMKTDANYIAFHDNAGGAGIRVDNGTCTITGNFIGTNRSGADLGNHYGIYLATGADTAVIGASTYGYGNAIGQSNSYNIYYQASSGTQTIKGNFIGTTYDAGTWRDLASQSHGIYVDGAGTLTIGGTSTGSPSTATSIRIFEGNFIAFHNTANMAGIAVNNGAPTIRGNYIGSNRAGTALGNDRGIQMNAGADNVTIGSATYGQGNVIGSNLTDIYSVASSGTQTIKGNFIGTTYDAATWRDLGSTGHGIFLFNATSTTVIGGTCTNGSGPQSINEGNYICFHDSILSAGIINFGSVATIQGNFIGTNRAGNDLRNTVGACLFDACSGAFGGTTYGQGNVVGRSSSYGIWTTLTSGTQTIKGNFIGTTFDAGTWRDLGNTAQGITVDNTGGTLTIGGVHTGSPAHGTSTRINEGNYIAFHNTASMAGIYVNNGAPTIQGNFIGTNRAGTDLGNVYGIQLGAGADNVTIGGTTYGQGNVIGQSDSFQLYYLASGGTQTVKGNFIGTTYDAGTWRDLAPVSNGIYVSGSGGLTIGGTSTGGSGPESINEGNYICFHNNVATVGIVIADGSPSIYGNYLGTNRAGTDLGNYYDIQFLAGADNVTIGSSTYGQGNVFGWSDVLAIYYLATGGTSNVKGNFIGTTYDAGVWRDLSPALYGLYLNGTGTLNIGGTHTGGTGPQSINEGNYICFFNTPNFPGITVFNGSPSILGNYLGTNRAGDDLGNSQAIFMNIGADNAVIGSSTYGQGNVIGWSDSYGIYSTANSGSQTIKGNYIGTTYDGGVWRDLGEADHGILINGAGVATIGGSSFGGSGPQSINEGNTIGFHNTAGKAGIYVSDGSPLIYGNYIGASKSGSNIGNDIGIQLAAGADAVQIGHKNSGYGNVICLNATDGILSASTSTLINVKSNLIGVLPNGTRARNLGDGIEVSAGTITVGDASSVRTNNIVGSIGQKSIRQTGGTMEMAGVNFVSGDCIMTGGTFDMNSSALVVSGDINPTGATFTIGTSSTITLDGAALQTLTGITSFERLHYRGTSYFPLGTYSIAQKLIVEKGAVTAPGVTVTLSHKAVVQVGGISGMKAVLSMDGATFTVPTPGTHSFFMNIMSGGDLHCAQNTLFDSLASTGIVFSSGSRMASNTILSNKSAQFRGVTFDNIPSMGYGIDLSALTAGDTNAFPKNLYEIRFNGLTTGYNVKAGANTPRFNFHVLTGNFGTVDTNGEDRDDDASDKIWWIAQDMLVVDTVNDTLDGTTSSIAALKLNRGPDGYISLRDAITAVNTDSSTGNTISFDSVVFPLLSQGQIEIAGSNLPSLTKNGTRIMANQAGVTLDGVAVISDGLTVSASSIVIKGLWIRNFTDDGIEIDATGSATIGGSNPADANRIMGNTAYGINFASNAGNSFIQGNYIGTYNGFEDRANGDAGIFVNGTGTLTIGGLCTGSTDGVSIYEGNYIAFHTTRGIQVAAGSPIIRGNYLGTNRNGDDIGNKYAITVESGAGDVTIGGSTYGQGNTLGGCDADAILYEANGGTHTIIGNYIGTTYDNGSWFDLKCASNGILVNCPGATLTIGGSTAGGVRNSNYIGYIDEATTAGINIVDGSCTIQGNYIGVDPTASSFPECNYSIYINTGADNITIGGTTPGQGNIFGKTASSGGTNIYYVATGGTQNIMGNWFGVTRDGALGGAISTNNNLDTYYGIYVNTAVQHAGLTIGGTAAGSGNIFGNFTDFGLSNAILISNGNATVQGNWFGTTPFDPTGDSSPNNYDLFLSAGADDVTIGGTAAGAGNVFAFGGFAIYYTATGGTQSVLGNFIGTNSAGTDLGGGFQGIYVNGTGTLTIGGSAAGSANTIGWWDSNAVGRAGIHVNNGSPVIKGNYIGTNAAGANIRNRNGIYLAAGADTVVIGGTAAGEGNIICNNLADGITSLSTNNSITCHGNLIGVLPGGTIAKNVGDGLEISAGTITLGSAGASRTNCLVGGAGNKGIRQTGGTLSMGGRNYVTGDLLMSSGTFTLGSSIMNVTGDILATGSTVSTSTSTVTLDGSRQQTLTSFTPVYDLHYAGTGWAQLASSMTIDRRLIVESRAVSCPSVTLTFANNASVKVGRGTASKGVLTLDNSTFTTAIPGTSRYAISLQPGGDIHARRSRFDSMTAAGLVFKVDSHLGSQWPGHTGVRNFTHVTFDNIPDGGYGMDLTSVLTGDDFPTSLSEVRFDKAGGATTAMNVNTSANDVPINFTLRTGDFGSVAADGESADTDPANLITWSTTSTWVALSEFKVEGDIPNDLVKVLWETESETGNLGF
ncbi:MAG: hypothetical protein AB7F75_09255, partial [Planctomycetota bacterium]